jgi:hypothetical protein
MVGGVVAIRNTVCLRMTIRHATTQITEIRLIDGMAVTTDLVV